MSSSETAVMIDAYPDVETRARKSLGISNEAIYSMVAAALDTRKIGGSLIDVGCGAGSLWPFIRHRFTDYIGVDAVRYDGFPCDATFIKADLNVGTMPLPNDGADVVTAVEIIEHLENPRAFMRELVRLVKLGGWVLITTPNQLSLLSLITLILKQRFSAFQDVHYPAHLTALLEIDLRRIASECGLVDVAIVYSHWGRMILTPWHYPRQLARLFPSSLSDNLLLIGRKAHG